MRLMPPDKRAWITMFLRWTGVFAAFAIIGVWVTIMPGRSFKGALPAFSAQETAMAQRLKQDVELFAGSIGEHNSNSYRQLQHVAGLLENRFKAMGYRVQEEAYRAQDKQVMNVVAELRGTIRPDEIVVLGAHYDSPPESPGANDNTSGVAALLELAARFKDRKPARTLRFVAFVNEEPPWFQTGLMGSRVNAARAKQRGENIVAMLALETIGYYSDVSGSQHYPPPFSLLYPDTADFIAFVGNTASRDLVRTTVRLFRDTTAFPSEGIAAPSFIKGIGWSDHWSYWQEGYPAIMITDTAPFRYTHYHESSDTPDKLDYQRMARVVSGIHRVIEGLVK